MKTVLVFSGGMDSTTLFYKLLHDGDTVAALSFNYGQRHKKELAAARSVCKKLKAAGKKVTHIIVDITSIKALLRGSALTDNIPLPEGHYKDKTMRATVVPNRNMIFLALAFAHAVSLKFNRVAIAVHAGDHAIYPDCRPEFIKRMQEVAKIADYRKIALYAPFLYMTKRQIAVVGRKLKVPFELTWTCYKGLKKPCGKCGACVERAEALDKN